jgi:hypothetical protein
MYSEVIGSQLVIRFVAGAPVERTDHARGRRGHDGAFLAPARGQPMIQRRHIGPLGQRRGMRQWRQTGPQSPITLPGLAGAWFAGTFVVPRGHTAPRGETSGRAQPGQVDPPLGHQPRPTPLIHAGNGVQPRYRPRIGQGGAGPVGSDRLPPSSPAPPGATGAGGVGAPLRSLRRRVMAGLTAARCPSRTAIWAHCRANNRR